MSSIHPQDPILLHIAASCIARFWNSGLPAGRPPLQGRTMSGQRTAPTPDRHNKAILIVPIAIALWFLDSYAFQYLTLDRNRFGIYWERREWLFVHIIAGMLALLLGPIQFWLGLYRREKLLHRILGGGYVLAVFTSGTAAIYLARHTDFGWIFGMGLTFMSVAWIVSTALAIIAISFHLVEQHREWMVRSYVLTYGFVIFRMFNQILQTVGVGTMLDQMTAASWFSWSVPLLVTECLIQGRKILLATKKHKNRKQEDPLVDLVPFCG
jgi:predicted membrane protein DUF2306